MTHGEVIMGVTRKEAIRLMGGAAAGAAIGLGIGGPSAASAGGGPVVRRDVCVLGGGSAGTYTAVRLRDLGASVAVVERQDRLGGHTETFHDPVTGGTIDIGVVVWHDLPLVRDYFGRFGIPLAPAAAFRADTQYLDLRTGHRVEGYAPPLPASLPTYIGLLQQHPYLLNGFDLPDPVPADLLMPFGEFVTKYGLETLMPLVWQFGQGLGDLLRMPTLYVMLNFGLDVVTGIATGSFVQTSTRNNSLLYERATDHLGDDVFLGSHVLSVERGRDGVRVLLATPHGLRTIHCGKLVVTFPPLLPAFTGFDLDARERSLFGQFRTKAYWTAVARLRGLPEGVDIANTGADTPHHLPVLPGIYGVGLTGVPELYNVKYGSDTQRSALQVRADIVGELGRIRTAGTYPLELERLEVLKSHSPFELHVDAPAIANGFYRRLYDLQGRNRTHYNGAAFVTHDSAVIWRFTEGLLASIAA
jgi:hypothetical protein